MKKDIALKIKVQFENANTIDELESALENINSELEEVDQNSDAFKILTSTADKATKEIDDLNSKIETLNGQSKTIDDGLKGLSGSTEIYANANKDLSSSLKEVTENGGAIAVLDSLTGGLASRFRDTLEASRLFNISLKGMRTALVATGIGAFIVALGLVVAYWDRIKDAIRGTTQKLYDKIDAIDKAQERLSNEVTLLEKQKTLYEIQGRLTGNLNVEHKKTLLLMQQKNQEQLTELQTLLDKEILQAKEITFAERMRILGAGLVNTQAALGEKILATLPVSKEILEVQEKIAKAKSEGYDIDIALAKLDKEKRDTDIQAAKDVAAVKTEIGDDITPEEEESLDYDPDQDAEMNAMIAKGQAIIDEEERQNKLKEDAAKKHAEEMVDWNIWKSEKIKENELASNDLLKSQAAGLYGDLKSLSQTFFADSEEGQKKAFEFNKMVSIAETLVSTYLAAQKAYASQMQLTPDSPIRAAIAAGMAVASGLARVASIKSTKFGSTGSPVGGGGGGGINGGSPQNIQPNVPILDIERPERKIKVIVTETDIRNVTSNISTIYDKAVVTE